MTPRPGHHGIAKYLRDARTFPRDALRAWRFDGLWGIWAELRLRTTQRVWRRWRAVVLEQEIAGYEVVPPPPGIEVRPCAAENLDALARIANRQMLAYFRRALAQGRTLLVAWRGERPVGYVLYSWTMHEDRNVPALPLPPDAAFIWYVYVVREERRRGVAWALLSAHHPLAVDRGVTRFWTAVQLSNWLPMEWIVRAGAKRRGHRVVGRITFRKVLGTVRLRFDPVEQAGS